jgi:hypothetical protein
LERKALESRLMISLSLDKREKKLQRQASRRRNRWKKIGITLLVLATFAGVVTAAEWYNATHQTRQPYTGPKPSDYQCVNTSPCVLVNQTTTFPYDNEWNFLLSAGKTVTIRVALAGGLGADVAFSMNGDQGNLVTPYLFAVRLNPTNPTGTWSGSLQTAGSYRIELGNAGDETNPATVQVFVEAT